MAGEADTLSQIFNLLPEQLRSLNREHIDYFKNNLFYCHLFWLAYHDRAWESCCYEQPPTPVANLLQTDNVDQSKKLTVLLKSLFIIYNKLS